MSERDEALKRAAAIVAKWPKWKREYCLTQEQADRLSRKASGYDRAAGMGRE